MLPALPVCPCATFCRARSVDDLLRVTLVAGEALDLGEAFLPFDQLCDRLCDWLFGLPSGLSALFLALPTTDPAGAVDGGALASATRCAPRATNAVASGAINRSKPRRRITQEYLVGELAAKPDFPRCGVAAS